MLSQVNAYADIMQNVKMSLRQTFTFKYRTPEQHPNSARQQRITFVLNVTTLLALQNAWIGWSPFLNFSMGWSSTIVSARTCFVTLGSASTTFIFHYNIPGRKQNKPREITASAMLWYVNTQLKCNDFNTSSRSKKSSMEYIYTAIWRCASVYISLPQCSIYIHCGAMDWELLIRR